jgi:tetratricopeptide (TPR) repeat protein
LGELARPLSWIVANRGVPYCRLRDYGKAFSLQQQGLAIVKENDHLDSQVVRLTDLAEPFLAMGKFSEAEQALSNAVHSASQDEKLNLLSSFPTAYVESPFLEDKLLHEMQSPGDDLRRGMILARLYLRSSKFAKALQMIEIARANQPELAPHSHFTALIHALVLRRLGRCDEAWKTYQTALEHVHKIQLRTPRFYPAQYTKGLALVGLAVLWRGEERNGFLKQAKDVYQKALEICSAGGDRKRCRVAVALTADWQRFRDSYFSVTVVAPVPIGDSLRTRIPP